MLAELLAGGSNIDEGSQQNASVFQMFDELTASAEQVPLQCPKCIPEAAKRSRSADETCSCP